MRILITILLVACSSILFGQKNAYTIKIKVAGLKDTVAYLANYYGDKQYIQDTVRIDKDGRFTFTGKEEMPGGIYLAVLPGKKYFEFIFTEPNFSLETDTLDYVKHMKVKGSVENELFYKYLNFIGGKYKESEPYRKHIDRLKDDKNKKDSLDYYREKMSTIDKEIKNYKLEFIKNHPQSFVSTIFITSQDPEIPETPILPNGRPDSTFAFRYYKKHFFDNVNFKDERILRTPLYHSKLEQYIKKLTVQIPDSINQSADYVVEKARANKELFKYTVQWITNTYETSAIMGMDAVYTHMYEKYYTYDQAYWVDSTTIYKINARAKTLKPLLLGKKAPNLVLEDLNGQMHALHNVKAKYTILVFWDPDCGHCQKVMPKLHDLYKKVKDKGIEVYAVCTEVEMDKLKKYIDEHKLEWINVADPKIRSNFRATYDITSTPQIYLLDEKKQIKAKKLDVDQLGDFIDRLLKEEKTDIK